MVIKNYLIGGLFLVAMLFSSCGHRPWCQASPEDRTNFMVERISRELALTKDQKTKLVKIKDEILVKGKEMRKTRSGVIERIIGEVKKDKFDTDAVNGDLDNAQAKMKEMRVFMVAKAAEFHAVLTPGQRTRLAANMEKIYQRFARFHGTDKPRR